MLPPSLFKLEAEIRRYLRFHQFADYKSPSWLL